MYADLGIKLDKALNLIKKALELDPENGAILDSMGWAYYRLGNYEMAQKTLEKAVKLEPNEKELRFHLGCVYEKLGYNNSAIIEFNKALALYPGYKEAQEALKRIQKTSAESGE